VGMCCTCLLTHACWPFNSCQLKRRLHTNQRTQVLQMCSSAMHGQHPSQPLPVVQTLSSCMERLMQRLHSHCSPVIAQHPLYARPGALQTHQMLRHLQWQAIASRSLSKRCVNPQL
jgi:hypothetical protein